jgi:nucleoside-triphosphatase
MKVLITGRPGCGKTTLVKRFMEASDKAVGGILSEEIRIAGTRRGFKIVDIASEKEGILAHVDQREGPRIGKYRVNLEDLDEIGVKAIEDALRESEIVIIDEIGPMELKSEKFINAVRQAFESGRDVIATIHYKSRHPVLDEIRGRKDVGLYRIDETNRDGVLKEILELTR